MLHNFWLAFDFLLGFIGGTVFGGTCVVWAVSATLARDEKPDWE